MCEGKKKGNRNWLRHAVKGERGRTKEKKLPREKSDQMEIDIPLSTNEQPDRRDRDETRKREKRRKEKAAIWR